MAYTPPQIWAHGDFPTAAKLNKYKDGLDAAYALSGSYEVHGAILKNATVDKGYYLVNRHPWLIYQGDGEIVDPAGVGTTVTISGDGTEWLTYELSGVEWLTVGKLYEVKDVNYCFEDYESV